MQHRWLIAVIALIVALGAAAWYAFDREYVIRIDEDTIRAQLEARLPMRRSLLRIAEVELAHPRVDFCADGECAGADRVRVGLDVRIELAGAASGRSFGGALDVEAGVRYDAADGRFYLVDPVITRLDVQDLPEAYRARLSGALRLLLAEVLSRQPIYTLRATDAKRAAARWLLKSVAVSGRELVVTLGR